MFPSHEYWDKFGKSGVKKKKKKSHFYAINIESWVVTYIKRL